MATSTTAMSIAIPGTNIRQRELFFTFTKGVKGYDVLNADGEVRFRTQKISERGEPTRLVFLEELNVEVFKLITCRGKPIQIENGGILNLRNKMPVNEWLLFSPGKYNLMVPHPEFHI